VAVMPLINERRQITSS